MEQFKGKVWVLGDDIDTDIIIPTEYLALPTVEDMKQYGFSPLRPELAGQIGEGDIIVAGSNFGCGSSREHAPLCLKTAGVSCVIAETFARIFYRNAINIGLPAIVCKDLPDDVKTGDILAYTGSTSSAVYFPDTVEIGNKSYPIDYIVCDSPVMEGGENIKVQQGAGMAVTKSDEEHEYAASVFLKWFTQKNQNLRFVC